MDNPSKKRTLWFTIVNAFLFLSTIIVCYITLCFGTVAGQVDTGTVYGWMYIITFTVQSNILLGIIALINLIFGIRNLRLGKPIPRAALVWYLVASSAAMLTALTVIFFLAPMRAINGRNYFDMLLGPMFFFHFFNPFLSAAAFICLTPKIKFARSDCFWALIPPIAYAVLYILNVIILETWPDFYNFTFGGHHWTILPVFIVISTITFSIAALLVYLHNHRKI
ncbi:hypothetical protein IJG27_01975 [Candidatus Saccharibacteria bacterium]|nr:hypothetical protein [Candidatus Saccharibacteria bacterium]